VYSVGGLTCNLSLVWPRTVIHEWFYKEDKTVPGMRMVDEEVGLVTRLTRASLKW